MSAFEHIAFLNNFFKKLLVDKNFFFIYSYLFDCFIGKTQIKKYDDFIIGVD